MSFEPVPEEEQKTCIIFNPTAGKGRSRRRLEALAQRWRNEVELWPTERAGHAMELARRAADRGFDMVAAAGGDGTVHEVAGGLLKAGRPDVCFAVLPLGSANDYAFSLRADRNVAGHAEGTVRQRVDVGHLRSDHGAEAFFVCSLGIGFGGSVTVHSRRIRHLQGTLLYGLATLRAMYGDWRHRELRIQLDARAVQRRRTLLLSFLIGRREGGFLMAPEARLDDGVLECLHAGPLTRLEVLKLVPRLALSGPPREHRKLSFEHCQKAVVECDEPLPVHTDGEIFCRQSDAVHRLEIELLPERLLVQLGLGSLQVVS